MSDYSNNNQQNLIAVVNFMAEGYLNPQTVQAVVDGTGLGRDAAFRTLWNLEKAGWVEEIGGAYRISGKFTKLAESAREALIKLFKEHLG